MIKKMVILFAVVVSASLSKAGETKAGPSSGRTPAGASTEANFEFKTKEINGHTIICGVSWITRTDEVTTLNSGISVGAGAGTSVSCVDVTNHSPVVKN